MTRSRKKVAVLKGGMSSEREVSLRSGAAVAQALKRLGYRVAEIDVGMHIAKDLEKADPDVVFNALHGTYGEDGAIQGLLEIMKIPYTHSGVLASAVAMDKPTAKILFAQAGINCAIGKVADKKQVLAGKVMPFPYVIKPTNNGSSVGVLVVKSKKDFDPKKIKSFESDLFLVEKYIEGTELSVAVMDGKAMGVIEIRPKKGFYDYKNKYTSGMTEYIIPSPVDKRIQKLAMKMSEDAHKVLGCRGVSRSDIIYNNAKGGDKKLYMLEVNTHPGMTTLSLVPKIANHVGISFEELVDSLVKSARCDN